MRKIALLMTCYNRVETTLRCLAGLVAQCGKTWTLDVFLVDDASPDGTGEKVRDWAAANAGSAFSLHVIAGRGNLFWSRGMRLAWDSAVRFADGQGFAYDFYLWLNDDVVLRTDALQTLLDDYDAVAPDGGAATIVGSFTTAPDSDEISYGTEHKGFVRVVPNGRPQRVKGYLAGNFVLVSRAVYERIGPIHGGFHHGGGDYDYAALMNERDIPFYCASRVVGWCPANRSNFTFKGKNLRQRVRLLWEPKGLCLHDTWLMRMRHGGLLRALVSVCHILWLVVTGRKW